MAGIGIIDHPIAITFISDPIIGGLCDRLSENQPLVKTAQQLLEALRDSKVLEDGTLNDDALKHFSLVLKTWRNRHFRNGINEIIHQPACVLPSVIEELSNGVTSQKIEQRMCSMKGDLKLRRILEIGPNTPPATMIRGLVLVVIGYWSYKKLPVEKEICEDDECDVGEDNVGGVLYDEKLMMEREEHNEWLMKYGSPIQKLEEEPTIEELADDLEKDLCLREKAQQCMEFLLNYDPDNDTEARCFVSEYGQRAKVRDILATINEIIGDPGLECYKKRIENNEVGPALRSKLKAADDYEIAIAKANDNIKGVLRYSTRFACDLKVLHVCLILKDITQSNLQNLQTDFHHHPRTSRLFRPSPPSLDPSLDTRMVSFSALFSYPHELISMSVIISNNSGLNSHISKPGAAEYKDDVHHTTHIHSPTPRTASPFPKLQPGG
ncbi:ankyrin repeat-containing protein 2 [Striga asiatica]|uniref:Ankyrin repeat-containing protein 2 n=1 Tax=Striga asiatica TaxID=4170 RepID=A0A5A7Q7X6_STRAF|nr:ankyrin repeat-containing protein 2 [Striga asiatica]